MRVFLSKLFFSICLFFLVAATLPGHPIYVSVVDVTHNMKSRSLEISCKIFTDDLEKALRKTYNTHIDLLDVKSNAAMQKYVNDYVQKHLQISVNSKVIALKFIGFEQEEEGVNCYFEASNVVNVTIISITDNILYEFESQQMGLLHCTVNGSTQHYKLNNPDTRAEFKF